ncbi:MAG: F0F1 ATP synthase subunit alpha [Actinomycetota bacterium]|nr:F0F1 ATP synthase subunit alpha [Actinomycetota bacterium]
MAELTIDPQDIAAALKRHVESFRPETEREEIGRVTDTGDGIARVSGLPGTMANELLEFRHDIVGVALNLEEDEIGCVIFGDEELIEAGDPVKRTGRILSVGVGDGLLGRVVDPIGRPLDGKGPIEIETDRALEVQAPSVVQRQPVTEPLQTGIKAIDAMTPIGRGQRELIIGDRQTGKSAIAIDTIINQRQNWASGDPKKQVKCIYVAIGQKASTVAEVVGALEENGALDYTVVVNAPASLPASFKFIAPYAGSAMGQHWMYKGQHALIVFDDLSKQAEAYREISLLLRRPPGREAYPGDVFYLHSRLLERCAKLSDELGGGSLTGLPFVETKGGDVSAYIPTNVISITDGQIYLETDLFNAGVRPAINVGISVSRVGGNAQIKAMKQVAGRLRLDLAQFRELEAFAEFGSELDRASQAQLERGARVVEILKQLQYRPMSVENQVLSIYAVTNGHLDDVPVPDVKRWEEEFLAFMESRYGDVGQAIVETGKLPDDLEERVKEAIGEFRSTFQPSEEGPPTAAGSGGGPIDKLREDVGWDRVGEQPGEGDGAGRDERDPGEAAPARTEAEEELQDRTGPVSDTDAQPPQ